MKRAALLLARYLKENNLTVAFAESMTCGLMAHKLGSTSGASEVLAGSIVCYDESVKTGLLKIKKSLIGKYTAESREVTDALAFSLRRLIRADVHVAVTGLAAPGGTETPSKPVGTVFCSVLYRGKLKKIRKRFTGSPLQVKMKACDTICRLIVQTCG